MENSRFHWQEMLVIKPVQNDIHISFRVIIGYGTHKMWLTKIVWFFTLIQQVMYVSSMARLCMSAFAFANNVDNG